MLKTARTKPGGSQIAVGDIETQPIENSTLSQQSAHAAIETLTENACAGIVAPTKGFASVSCRPIQTQSRSFRRAQRQLRPFEELTGIAHDRPEIIAIMNFQPLYDNEQLTHVGKFVDLQRQLRQMKRVVAQSIVQTASSMSKTVQDELKKRDVAIKAELDSLGDASAFLLNVVRTMIRLRGQLDLRDTLDNIDPQQIVAQHIIPLRSRSIPRVISDETQLLGAFVPNSYSVLDLMQRLGFNRNVAATTFSSTKLWLQLLEILNEVLVTHSADLIDSQQPTRSLDQSPNIIVRSTTKHFSIDDAKLPMLAELTSVNVSGLSGLLDVVEATLKDAYDNAHIKSEETRIAVICNMISQEFRYSLAFGNGEVRRQLNDDYDTDVVNGHGLSLFRSLIGQPRHSAIDVPKGDKHSLAAVAQSKVGGDSVVLTFESSFVADATLGTFTPGAAYYVDDILNLDGNNFNTARLDALAALMTSAQSRFGRTVVGMDLLASGRASDDASGRETVLIGNPIEFFKHLKRQFVDPRWGISSLGVTKDLMTAVFAETRTDMRLRAMLFVLMLARLAESEQTISFPTLKRLFLGHSHSVFNALIEQIMARLHQKSQKIQKPAADPNAIDSVFSVETVRDSLRAGSHSMRLVESFMITVYDAFVRNAGIADGKTRFRGYKDTLLLVMAFDLMCAMLSTWGRRTIVGTHHVAELQGDILMPSVDSFVVRISRFDVLASIADVETRLQREVALIRQLVCTVFAALTKISSSITTFSSYLKAPKTTMMLRRISSVVGSNDRLRAVFSEQQVLLLSSTVQDLIAFARTSRADRDRDGHVDGIEEIAFLDEACTTPQVASMIATAFSSSEFGSRLGANKRVLSIGIPNGLSSHMRRVVDSRVGGSFSTRQDDIVRVIVHKIDVQEPDIVFYPKEFLFELSRFPVRDSTKYLTIPAGANVRDVIVAIPTRDEGSSLGSLVTHANPADVGSERMARFLGSRETTFSDPDHAFLTSLQRREIATNHVLSYLLELYIRLLTGLSFAEHHFELDLPTTQVNIEMMRAVSAGRMAHVDSLRPTGGQTAIDGTQRVFNTASNVSRQQRQKIPLPNNVRKPAATSRATQEILKSDAQVLPVLANGLSTLSDPLSVSSAVLMPKRFDRVFNVVIDPDEFDIDELSTVKTEFGKRVLEALKSRGDVIVVQEQSGGPSAQREHLRFHERDRSTGDMAFERYFITIEPAFKEIR